MIKCCGTTAALSEVASMCSLSFPICKDSCSSGPLQNMKWVEISVSLDFECVVIHIFKSKDQLI